MSNSVEPPRALHSSIAFLATLAAATLGAIAFYSSGVGLVDPKLHRALGFALALLVGVALAREKRWKSCSGQSAPNLALPTLIDITLVLGGLWSIWSFYSVQTQMEEALYDVSTRDAWPALVGLAVFLELCRRLWGWGLFCVGALAVLYLFTGQHAIPTKVFSDRLRTSCS